MSSPFFKLSVPPLLDLSAQNEHDAISGTLDLLRGHPSVNEFAVFRDAVFARQKTQAPLLGEGNCIALPHARTDAVRELLFAAARPCREVHFSEEASAVRLIFLFAVPPSAISEYLAVTARLVRLLKDPVILERLFHTADAEEFASLLTFS